MTEQLDKFTSTIFMSIKVWSRVILDCLNFKIAELQMKELSNGGGNGLEIIFREKVKNIKYWKILKFDKDNLM